jgi:hypothetical protein
MPARPTCPLRLLWLLPRLPMLCRAHAQARAQLAAAQLELRKIDKLPIEPPAPLSAAAAGEGNAKPAATAGAETMPPEAPGSAAGQQKPASSRLHMPAQPTAGASPQAQQQQPVSGADALKAASSSSGSSSSSSNSAGDGMASEAAAESVATDGSSLASFAFQDVLSGWAAGSKQMPARAAAAGAAARKAVVMGRQNPAAAASVGGRDDAGQRAAAAAAAHGSQRLAESSPVARAPDASAASAVGRVADTAAVPASPAAADGGQPVDGGSSSGSSSDGGSSFGLQWGDQLLSWAGNVRVEAAAVVQHAAQAQPLKPPAKQQVAGQHNLQQRQGSSQAQQAPREQAAPQQQQQPLPAASLAVSALGAGQRAAGSPTPGLLAAQGSLGQHSHGQRLTEQRPGSTSSLAGTEGQSTGGTAAVAVDIATWLNSAARPAAEEAGPSLPAPAALQPAGEQQPTFMPPVPALAQLQQEQQGAAPPTEYVQRADGVPGAFRCQLCQVTVSGQRNLAEHLGSKRHVKRVAAEAATAAAAAAGPEAQQGLGLAELAATAAGASGGAGAAGGGGGKTYIGATADVAPYVCQVCHLGAATCPAIVPAGSTAPVAFPAVLLHS